MDLAVATVRQSRSKRDLWSLGVLPVLALGALAGLLGIYWDVAWHIDVGRDTFFTLPHNFLYSSIAVVLVMSLYGLLRDRRDTPFHLRWRSLRLHPGVLIVAVGAALELLFAPMDELWHQLFGIDVILWAPMHLIGIMGLALASFGGLVSAWLEQRLAVNEERKRYLGRVTLFFAAAVLGWIILLLAEFDFNTPQFPSFWHPLLLVGLPPTVLVLVRTLTAWRWAATVTALLYTAFRLGLAGWLMVTASLDLAGYTRAAPDPTANPCGAGGRPAGPPRSPGLAAGAVILLSNWSLVALGSGIVWYPEVLARAVLPGLALAASTGSLGAWVAGSLNSQSGGLPSGVASRTLEEVHP